MTELTEVEKYIRHVVMLRTALPPDDMEKLGKVYEIILELEAEIEKLRAADKIEQIAFDKLLAERNELAVMLGMRDPPSLEIK